MKKENKKKNEPSHKKKTARKRGKKETEKLHNGFEPNGPFVHK